MKPEHENVTRLLRAWSDGDSTALDILTPLVYEELRRLARRTFRGERPGHTLQPTALVNEAFVRLAGSDVAWQDRKHFFALSARMMRRILVSHATARNASKRGGGEIRVTLDESAVGAAVPDDRLLDLDAAVSRLAALDPRQGELLELSVFSGLTFEEMASVTGLSTSTIDRELRLARAWIKRELTG